MIKIIKEGLKEWDWKRQTVGSDNFPISNLIGRIESGYYKTKKVKLSLDVINLRDYQFECPNLFEFMIHYKLVEDSELKYPIIINREGCIIDGRHRLCKAILKGDKYINGIMILDSSVV